MPGVCGTGPVKSYKPQDDEKSLCTSDYSQESPGYGSVVFQIREANDEATGVVDFIKRTLDILGSTVAVTVVVGAFMALPISMVSIGVKYLHDCPKEPKIPIYLLVGGCFGMLKLMSVIWKQVRARRYERMDHMFDSDEETNDPIMSRSTKFTDSILSLFLFVWFIFGNIWVFNIWKPHYKPLLHEPNNWCEETVYLFAFVQLMISYGLIALMFCCLIFLACCHHCRVKT